MGKLPGISAEPTFALGAQRPPPSYVWDEVGASQSTWEGTRVLNCVIIRWKIKNLKATGREEVVESI